MVVLQSAFPCASTHYMGSDRKSRPPRRTNISSSSRLCSSGHTAAMRKNEIPKMNHPRMPASGPPECSLCAIQATQCGHSFAQIAATLKRSSTGHFHAVRFYEDDKSLCRIVSNFIAEGLTLDQPAVVIATRPHIDAIVDNLAESAIDV